MSRNSVLGIALHPDTERFFESVGLHFLVSTEKATGFDSSKSSTDENNATRSNSSQTPRQKPHLNEDWGATAFGCGSRPAPNSIGRMVESDISRICTERQRSHMTPGLTVKTPRNLDFQAEPSKIPEQFIPQYGTSRRPYIGSSWRYEQGPSFRDTAFPSSLPQSVDARASPLTTDASNRYSSAAENEVNSQGWQRSPRVSVAGPKPPQASVSLERASTSPPAWEQVIMFGGDKTESNHPLRKGRRLESLGPSLPAASGKGAFAGTVAWMPAPRHLTCRLPLFVGIRELHLKSSAGLWHGEGPSRAGTRNGPSRAGTRKVVRIINGPDRCGRTRTLGWGNRKEGRVGGVRFFDVRLSSLLLWCLCPGA